MSLSQEDARDQSNLQNGIAENYFPIDGEAFYRHNKSIDTAVMAIETKKLCQVESPSNTGWNHANLLEEVIEYYII